MELWLKRLDGYYGCIHSVSAEILWKTAILLGHMGKEFLRDAIIQDNMVGELATGVMNRR